MSETEIESKTLKLAKVWLKYLNDDDNPDNKTRWNEIKLPIESIDEIPVVSELEIIKNIGIGNIHVINLYIFSKLHKDNKKDLMSRLHTQNIYEGLSFTV